MSRLNSQYKLAQAQWSRYTSALERGHKTYQKEAKVNEKFYFAKGNQWDEDVKALLEAQGKPWLEEPLIFSTVNTVIGYQTQSRMEVTYKPREESDQFTSDILSKLGMFILDQVKFPWIESQVFADGLIQQRGYYDIRMDFDENMYGNIAVEALDPLDVIPDPDAKTYDPEGWQDVIVTKWMPVDDIKLLYGTAKYRKVIREAEYDPDFGEGDDGEKRNKFGWDNVYNAWYRDETGQSHVRVLERQWYKLQNREFWFDIELGDFYPIPDDMTDKEKKDIAKENNFEIIKKLSKRVRWTISTKDSILYDDWSPYEFFTIVPYFAYFRRGVTVGLVDNLIKTQEMINKVFSQILHVVNTTANSGWLIEEDSLSNMDVEDLEDRGAETGLVIEYRRGKEKPEKIEPNQVPTGLKDLVNTGVELLRMISGVSETFQGGKGPEVSGTAIQNRVHQSAIQLATPLDNLFRTRTMIGERILTLMQQFYTEPRVFMITDYKKESPTPEQVIINEEREDGEVVNDITKGKYDVVIADIPTQVSFQNAQFQQAIEMRKFGVQIPDSELIKMSTLSRKNEIAEQVSGEANEEQMQKMREQYELQIAQLEGTIEELQARTTKTKTDAFKNAATIAQMLAENPSIAPILDNLLEQGITEDAEEVSPEEAQQTLPEEEILPRLGNF